MLKLGSVFVEKRTICKMSLCVLVGTGGVFIFSCCSEGVGGRMDVAPPCVFLKKRPLFPIFRSSLPIEVDRLFLLSYLIPLIRLVMKNPSCMRKKYYFCRRGLKTAGEEANGFHLKRDFRKYPAE